MIKQISPQNDFFVIAEFHSVFRDSAFLRTKIHTDHPERLSAGKTVFLEFFGEFKQLTIEDSYREGTVFFVKIKNFDDKKDCEQLSGKFVYIPKTEAAPLAADSYYIHDLIGSTVYATDGLLGVISDVMLLPANDAYVVALPDEKELLVPALKQIIEGFDAGKKELRLRVDKAYLGYED